MTRWACEAMWLVLLGVIACGGPQTVAPAHTAAATPSTEAQPPPPPTEASMPADLPPPPPGPPGPPPPPGQSSWAQLARTAAAPGLGVPADQIDVAIVGFERGVRALSAADAQARPGAPVVGVMVHDDQVWTRVEQVHASAFGEDPVIMALAVSTLHMKLETGPLTGAGQAPAFDSQGQLVFTFEDPRARGRQTRAEVELSPAGGVKKIQRTPVP